jgi:glycosyltransferase involved in cell wall biosynthesis
MRIFEIGTGYTEIPPKIGAATEVVVENLYKAFSTVPNVESNLVDIAFDKQNKHAPSVYKLYVPASLKGINDKGYIHLLRRISYSIKLAFFLKKLAKNISEDTVFHFHNQFNFFFFYNLIKMGVATKNPKVKLAYTIHSPSWSEDVAPPKNLKLEVFAIKNSDYVISLTNNIKNNILSQLGSDNKLTDRINVIPNGVNIEVYKPIEAVKQRQIVNIGSVCPRKNQLQAIKILQDFLIKNNFTFVFAGKIIDTEYYNEILSYISTNSLTDNVKYLGEVEPGHALNTLYNSSLAYFSVSKSEAFSLVVLESLAAGLPVVLSDSFNNSLSDIKELPDCIRISSTDLIVNEVDNVIRQNLDNNRLSDQARKFVTKEYSWHSIVMKHLSAFLFNINI